eukprot:9058158-Pyramimonas_sp.AAC.1
MHGGFLEICSRRRPDQADGRHLHGRLGAPSNRMARCQLSWMGDGDDDGTGPTGGSLRAAPWTSTISSMC